MIGTLSKAQKKAIEFERALARSVRMLGLSGDDLERFKQRCQNVMDHDGVTAIEAITRVTAYEHNKAIR